MERPRLLRTSTAVIVAALIVGGIGCSPAKREELAQQVLMADPEFGPVLEKHHELSNRIETYERELALKRGNSERAITQLRKDLAATTASVRSKVAETKKKIEPDRKRLEEALAQAAVELKSQRARRAAVGGQMAQLRKTMKSGGSVWTAEEQAQQRTKLEELTREAERLDHEMVAMKGHVRLLRLKLLLIKL